MRLIDSQTYETLDRIEMDEAEKACSICSVSFENDPEVYYCVGTAHCTSMETEPTSGRICVYVVQDGKLVLVAAKDTKGTVYILQPFQVGSAVMLVGSKLVGGIFVPTGCRCWCIA